MRAQGVCVGGGVCVCVCVLGQDISLKVARSAMVSCSDLLENDIKCVY